MAGLSQSCPEFISFHFLDNLQNLCKEVKFCKVMNVKGNVLVIIIFYDHNNISANKVSFNVFTGRKNATSNQQTEI